MSIEFEWVDDNNWLDELVEQWCNEPYVAIDTEFMRQTTYYPEVALVQVADSHGVYLIEPKHCDLSLLAPLMAEPKVVKVLHAASEDLEVFHRAAGCMPQPLLDTQLAAAMLGFDHSMGFARLVEALTGVVLPKDATRSDWLKRPLTQQQLQYACNDVVYLRQVYELLQIKLVEQQRFDWVIEESAMMHTRLATQVPEQEYYLRMKGAGRMNQRQLAALQSLAAWREGVAKQKNKARGHCLADKTLLAMAAQLPQSSDALAKIEGMSPGLQNKYGSLFLQFTQDAVARADTELPPPAIQPLNSSEKQLLKKMQSKTAAVAEAENVAVELLARKKDLSSWIQGADTENPLCNGWRKPLLASLIGELS